MKKEYLILGGLALIGVYLLIKKSKIENNQDLILKSDGIKSSKESKELNCPEGKVKKAISGGFSGGFIYACV